MSGNEGQNDHAASTVARLREWARAFWAAPVTPRPLAWFRIGLAGVLLVQALFLVGHLEKLFGGPHVVGLTGRGAGQLPGVPDARWVEGLLGLVGVPVSFGAPLLLALYVSGLLGLLLGWHTRWSAVLAWLSHTVLMTSNNLALYGVDQFAQIGLFYCVWLPVGHALSLDRNRGAASGPSFDARLGLRVLQLHVCIIYTASGVEKALGEQWWNGEAIWRAVMGAPLDGPPIDCSFLAAVPWLAQSLCWTTLLLEAGVVAFVWHPRLRKLWLVGIVGMHLNIALLMNLWTFSATMIVFDIAAFGVKGRASPAETTD